MALGDLVVFNKAMLAMWDGTHDLDSDVFKCAVLDNTTTPLVTDLTPALGDYTEVGSAGSYVAGGITLTISLTEAAAVVTFDSTVNPSWAQDALNDVDAYWGLIYNDTNPGKEALAFVDAAGPFNMSTGALTFTWDALGLFTLAKAP